MKRVSAIELIRKFGTHGDDALSTPIIVTKNGQDRVVLISIEQYHILQHAYDAVEEARSGNPAPPSGTGRRKD